MKVHITLKALDHFDETLGPPHYQSLFAAGADLRACLPDRSEMIIAPWERALVPTGLAVEIPPGHEIQIRPRSGLSLKTQLLVANSPGTIDADYRGEVMVILANLGPHPYTIKHGDRVAQMVVNVLPQVEFKWAQSLSESERGVGGFGSTGVS